MSKATQQRAASTRREQLRAQQLAEARKKQRTMRLIYAICAVVALAVIATVTVVVINDRNAKRDRAAMEAQSQIVPPSALPDGSGYLVNPGKFAEGAPVITVYQDYQCPACKSAEDYFGKTIQALAESGKIRLEYKTLTFLDTNLRNDASTRAALAAACADVVGSYKAFHDGVYANQPAQEGSGYTEQQLRQDIPTQVGITGAKLTEFQACYDGKKTSKWVREENQKASETFLGSTPQISIDGKNPKVQGTQGETDWWRVLEPTEESWLKAIAEHGDA